MSDSSLAMHAAGCDSTLPARLMSLLSCPACRGGLTQQSPDHLCCGGCGAKYPVRNGVPRLLPGELPTEVSETAEAFGWQWHAFPEQISAFREEFLEWISPLTPSDFSEKTVLDAGCGKGRHLLVAADFGAKHVVGLDLSAAVDVARAQTATLSSVDVVQGNLLSPPFAESSFDLIYSVGVIHHVPDPAAAVRALTRCLRPGGTLHVWVYGYEGNELVRWLVDPCRRVLARHVPRGLVRSGSLPLALLLLGLARFVARFDFLPFLPYRAYLKHIAPFSVRHVWTIVYDQLMAPTTHYIEHNELLDWFRATGLTDIRLRRSRGMSWAATGVRPHGSGAANGSA